MVARVYSRSLSVVRWSRDRIQNQLRRLFRPRLSGLVLYILITIFILCSFTSIRSFKTSFPNSSSLSSKEKRPDRSNGVLSGDDNARLNTPILNPHSYHLMISNSRLCSDEEQIHLLILITSSADHFNERQAIRSTWGNPDYLSIYFTKLIFLLANPNNLNVQRKIVEEYRTYGDLIQEDFVESYVNLTLKTVMGIKWASLHCSSASYVMKTDDDIFVNVPLLTTHLKSLKSGRLFTGCIKQKNAFMPVNGDPSAFLPPAHPLFAAGAGYVFSGSLLPNLFEASKYTRIIPVEDVYITGHLAKAVDAHPPLHDDRFTCGEILRNHCQMLEKFTGHKISFDAMFDLWNIFDPNKVQKICS